MSVYSKYLVESEIEPTQTMSDADIIDSITNFKAFDAGTIKGRIGRATHSKSISNAKNKAYIVYIYDGNIDEDGDPAFILFYEYDLTTNTPIYNKFGKNDTEISKKPEDLIIKAFGKKRIS